MNAMAALTFGLAPWRAEAERLGFRLMYRNGEDCSHGRRCIDALVHDSGIWLDMSGHVHRGRETVVLEFRSWVLSQVHVMEVTSRASTRSIVRVAKWLERHLLPEELRVHRLESADDLAAELERHRSILSHAGLQPLRAAGDEWASRAAWWGEARASAAMVPP